MKKIGMILFVIFVAIFIFVGVEAGAGGKKYLNIGENPVAPKQFNPATEDLYSLSQDTLMEIGQKGGKKVRGYVRAGTKVVTPKGATKVVRIYECGNPVFNEVYVSIGMPLTTLVEKDDEYGVRREDEERIDLYHLPPATQERIESKSKPIEVRGEGRDIFLKITNCASAMAIGWGLQSNPKRDENFAIGGTAGLVVSYSFDKEITFGDILTTAVCGAIGALVAPVQPSSGSVMSQLPISSSPPPPPVPPPSGGSGGPITPPPVPPPSGGSTSGGSTSGGSTSGGSTSGGSTSSGSGGGPVAPPPIP